MVGLDMNKPGHNNSPDFWIVTAMAIGAWACLVVWMAMVSRVWRGLPILAYQPRRRVPWRFFDLVAVLVFSVLAGSAMAIVGRAYFGLPETPGVAVDATAELDTVHPIGRLLLEEPSVATLALCLLTAVVVAPIAEEFLFRLLLQGWLEAFEWRLRRRLPVLRIPLPLPMAFVAAINAYVALQFRLAKRLPGVLPVAFVAVLFAAVHFRVAKPHPSTDELLFRLGLTAVISLLTVGFGVALFRFRSGATLRDFGIVVSRLPSDVILGLIAYVAVTPPVYFVMILAHNLLPRGIVADPIPLLFLAVALGYLYYKTHRIVSAIVLHMAFNATALAIALLSLER